MSWCNGPEYWTRKQVINLAFYYFRFTSYRYFKFHSLRNLIREGSEERTFVRVTLLNQGVDAYRQEIYGDRICIEREISKSSSSGYKILAKNGKVIYIYIYIYNQYNLIFVFCIILLVNIERENGA